MSPYYRILFICEPSGSIPDRNGHRPCYHFCWTEITPHHSHLRILHQTHSSWRDQVIGRNNYGSNYPESIKQIFKITCRIQPANHIYFLYGLDTITFSIVAVNKLVYKITPPHLLATMAGVTNSMQFGLGRGLGAFLSGQIYTHTGLSLAQVLSLTQFPIDSKMPPSLAQ